MKIPFRSLYLKIFIWFWLAMIVINVAFFAAVALLHREARFGAIAGAGALMALAGLLRFQFGPAIALFALLTVGKDRRMWGALLLGDLPVVLGGGLLDIAMGLRPYEWIINNYNANIAQGRMKEIGGVETWYYVKAIPHYSKWAVVPILVFIAWGWRRNPALLAAALLNIAVHQFVGHKEYRYLWLSIEILLLLAAFGSYDLLVQAGRNVNPRAGSPPGPSPGRPSRHARRGR